MTACFASQVNPISSVRRAFSAIGLPPATARVRHGGGARATSPLSAPTPPSGHPGPVAPAPSQMTQGPDEPNTSRARPGPRRRLWPQPATTVIDAPGDAHSARRWRLGRASPPSHDGGCVLYRRRGRAIVEPSRADNVCCPPTGHVRRRPTAHFRVHGAVEAHRIHNARRLRAQSPTPRAIGVHAPVWPSTFEAAGHEKGGRAVSRFLSPGHSSTFGATDVFHLAASLRDPKEADGAQRANRRGSTVCRGDGRFRLASTPEVDVTELQTGPGRTVDVRTEG